MRKQQQTDVALEVEMVPEVAKKVAKVTIKNELNQVVNISLTNGSGIVLDPSGKVVVDEEVTKNPHVKDLVKVGAVRLIKQ